MKDLLRCCSSIAVAFVVFAASTGAAFSTEGSLSSPLVLKDKGAFFVNGQTIVTNFPSASPTAVPGRVVVNQMYVEYMIPANDQNKPPVVMVHGSNHTGMTYSTTPDGREGWATYFVRKGYPVYVVDQVGRARSSWDTTSTNQAKAQSNPALIPGNGFSRSTYESAWSVFRLGPTPDVFWADSRFPQAAIDQYMAQLVPNTDVSLPNRLETTNALSALLQKIGPAVVMAHSMGGQFAIGVSYTHPELVRGAINVEGTAGNACTLNAAQIAAISSVPVLTVFADHIAGSLYVPGKANCTNQTNAINAAGGDAILLSLPDIGIYGNSHMMMMESNNLQIADHSCPKRFSQVHDVGPSFDVGYG